MDVDMDLDYDPNNIDNGIVPTVIIRILKTKFDTVDTD